MEHPRKDAAQVISAIKTILELSQVAIGIFIKVKGVGCPRNRCLEVSQDGIDPMETTHVGAFSARSNNLWLVGAACFCHRTKAP